MSKKILFLVFGLALFTIQVFASDNSSKTNAPKDNNIVISSPFSNPIKISGQWFLAYQNGEKKGDTLNSFHLKRGYITIKQELSSNFSVRLTQDITVDEEGGDAGNVEIRLKYGYLRYTFDNFGFLTKPFIEAGLVHRPWVAYEQGINRFRVQGLMFMNRAKIMSSADYGVMFSSLLGGEMSDDYKAKVNKNDAGRYGSFAIGVYNGGGYHAIETNNNKIIESRLSLRPMPDLVPGLQVSFTNGFGKGNTELEPDWNFNAIFGSFENENLVLTGQYYTGTGNEAGKALEHNKSYDQNGYSFFGEVRLLSNKVSLFGRYDRLNRKTDRKSNYQVYIGGLAFHFIKGSQIVLDYDYKKDSLPGVKEDGLFEVAIEFNF